MSQISKPNSDISNSTWTLTPSPPTTVYEHLNETSYDDGNYVTSIGTIPQDSFEVGMEDIVIPQDGTWTLKVRWCVTGSGSGPVRGKVELRQEVEGTVSTIAMRGDTPGGSFDTFPIILTQPEIDLLQIDTDGRIRGLRVRVSAIPAAAPDCCPTLLLTDLTLTFSGGTGSCSVLNGQSFKMERQPDSTSNYETRLITTKCGTMSLVFNCGASPEIVNLTDPGAGCSILSSPFSTFNCSPFVYTNTVGISPLGSSPCGCSSCNVTVTVTV